LEWGRKPHCSSHNYFRDAAYKWSSSHATSQAFIFYAQVFKDASRSEQLWPINELLSGHLGMAMKIFLLESSLRKKNKSLKFSALFFLHFT
jgi:hypothetical protein